MDQTPAKARVTSISMDGLCRATAVNIFISDSSSGGIFARRWAILFNFSSVISNMASATRWSPAWTVAAFLLRVGLWECGGPFTHGWAGGGCRLAASRGGTVPADEQRHRAATGGVDGLGGALRWNRRDGGTRSAERRFPPPALRNTRRAGPTPSARPSPTRRRD